MTPAEAARLLRDLATSYARDAEALQRAKDGDAAMMWTIRDELRKMADKVEDLPEPSAHCVCQWCSGETRADGECACAFCLHRKEPLHGHI